MSQVQEVLHGWGGWDLELSESCPGRLLELASPWSHGGSLVRIYSSRVDPGQVGAKPGALFAGPVMRQTGGGRFLSGPGPSWYLGTYDGDQSIWRPRDGAGPFTVSSIAHNGTTSGTMSQWVTSILDLTLSGLTLGSTAGSPTYRWGGNISSQTARTILDSFIRPVFNVDYRVNSDFTVDVQPEANLYQQQHLPIVTRVGGRGGNRLGLQVQSLDLESDAWDRLDGVRIHRGGGSYSGVDATVRWKAPDGSNLNWRGIRDEVDMPADEAGIVAAEWMRESHTVRSASLSTLDYELPTRALVGGRVEVWDPDAGFHDMSRAEVRWQGESIWPVTLQIAGSRWPISGEMSVWLDQRHMGGGLHDLTEYVVLGEGESVLDLGSPPKTMGRSISR